MPTDYPRQSGQTYTAFIESLLLPARLGEDLKRLCVDLDVTLFMVLFATYVTLLYRYTGQARFMIGTTAGKSQPLGNGASHRSFREPPDPEPGGLGRDDLSRACRADARSLAQRLCHQEVPFEIVLEKLQERKTGGRKPAIQTHFLYQKAFMESATYGDLAIRPLRSVSRDQPLNSPTESSNGPRAFVCRWSITRAL